jgi:hypothetical protein
MQFRIRSKLLKANLHLLILSALRSQPLSKWELVHEIYSGLSLVPDEDELERAIQVLIDGGFVQILTDGAQRRMSVNARGLELLSRLESLRQKYPESPRARFQDYGR